MESNVCVGVADKRGEAAYLRSISSKRPQFYERFWKNINSYCPFLSFLVKESLLLGQANF